MKDTLFRVTEDDPNEDPGRYTWEPTWTVTVDGSDVGVTIDDHAVVFLAETAPRQWMPLTHVPAPAIRFVANLLARTD